MKTNVKLFNYMEKHLLRGSRHCYSDNEKPALAANFFQVLKVKLGTYKDRRQQNSFYNYFGSKQHLKLLR